MNSLPGISAARSNRIASDRVRRHLQPKFKRIFVDESRCHSLDRCELIRVSSWIDRELPSEVIPRHSGQAWVVEGGVQKIGSFVAFVHIQHGQEII